MKLVKDKEYAIYVTTHALTIGIQKVTARAVTGTRLIGLADDWDPDIYTKGINSFFRYSDAVKKAELMRQKKIASLEKQLKKIRGLKFNDEEL